MYLTRETINVSDGRNLKSGASLVFLGTVRNRSEGKEVLYLEYEAYEVMAERMLEELVKSAFEKWKVEDIELFHRLDHVKLGEIAVMIEVRSIHRDEAYQASRYLIEGIKHKVPIWKKEYFKDGTSEWSLCSSHVELRASA